jgi:hypothetical protein
LSLLDPQRLHELGDVATDVLDELLGVLAADEHVERVTERALGPEIVVDDGVDNDGDTMAEARAVV